LDIHLGNGKLQGALASLATFEGRRLEFDVSRLRNAEMKFSEPAVDDFGFEAVGVPAAVCGSLVGLGLQHLGTLELHGFVQQDLDGVRHSFEPLLGQDLDDVLNRGRLLLVGHAVLLLC
jgi:hypothetical protein